MPKSRGKKKSWPTFTPPMTNSLLYYIHNSKPSKRPQFPQILHLQLLFLPTAQEVVSSTIIPQQQNLRSNQLNHLSTLQLLTRSHRKMLSCKRLRIEYGIAWSMYMHFERRSEGMKSLCGIFGKARRDRWIPWEVYEASGLCLSFLFFIRLGNNHSSF